MSHEFKLISFVYYPIIVGSKEVKQLGNPVIVGQIIPVRLIVSLASIYNLGPWAFEYKASHRSQSTYHFFQHQASFNGKNSRKPFRRTSTLILWETCRVITSPLTLRNACPHPLKTGHLHAEPRFHAHTSAPSYPPSNRHTSKQSSRQATRGCERTR